MRYSLSQATALFVKLWVPISQYVLSHKLSSSVFGEWNKFSNQGKIFAITIHKEQQTRLEVAFTAGIALKAEVGLLK